jgi:diguanylate cyclase
MDRARGKLGDLADTVDRPERPTEATAVVNPGTKVPSRSGRDHQSTIGYARTALGQIVSLELPADPPSFEVFYTYAAKHNPMLNEAINEMIARCGAISVADLDTIYDQFLSSAGLASRIGDVGNEITDHVDRVVDMIDTAIRTTTGYSHSLSGASEELSGPVDKDVLRRIVGDLLTATQTVDRHNAQLEESLRASRQQITELQHELETVSAESSTDALTKVSNRKCFDEALKKAIAEASAKGTPLSLLMCDVDHFKSFNDRFGHVIGDTVLRLIASTIKQTIRGEDIAARYGGEEFAVILPRTTRQQAAAVAENIRTNVMQRPLIKRSTGQALGIVTISIGVAEYAPGETLQALVERADAGLYAAKRAGRNRVAEDAVVGSPRLQYRSYEYATESGRPRRAARTEHGTIERGEA